MNTNAPAEFARLVEIMSELREKCPWDKKQTIHSLRQMTIEETYELADAITDSDWKSIREELGDLMLHIVFYARIAEEKQQFTLSEVVKNICDKLINRHPHIYSDVKVNSAEDVKRNWEKIKLDEGKTSILSGVPRSLPSTVKAMRLQEKASQTGFDWDNIGDVWKKVEEEMEELKTAIQRNNAAETEAEFGDLMFSLINYARFLQVDAENALELTNKKFIYRFTALEDEAKRMGRDLNDMSLQEMDSIWNSIKLRNKPS